MKHLLFLLLCGFFISSATGEVDKRPYGERHQCRIDEKRTLILAENGVAQADIVLPENCSKIVDFAAKELKRYLDKATGADFKILRSTSFRRNPQPVRTRTALMLGESQWTEGLTGIKFAALPRDTFVIKEINGAIIIAGHDDPFIDPEKEVADKSVYFHRYEHATLFAVYDFLERFAGVRFYFPVDEMIVVPRSSALKVPSMDIEESPDFTVRCAYWPPHGEYADYDCKSKHTYWKTRDEMNKARHLQTLYSRGSTIWFFNSHGLQQLALVERFGKTHPEYFALTAKGQRIVDLGDEWGGHPAHLCYSSQGLEDEIFKDAKSYLSAESPTVRDVRVVNRWVNTNQWSDCFYPGYFSLMPSDGMLKCYCEKCKPYVVSDRISDLLFGFTSRIAQRLKDEHIKGTITTMPYSYYIELPQSKLPDNVIVMICPLGPWKEQDLKADERKKPDQLLVDWYNLTRGNKVSVWNYMISDGGMTSKGIPPCSPRNVAAYYKRNAPVIDGSFTQFGIWTILHNYLNMYVYGKVGWNTQTDVEQLLAEHHQKLFGPAAKPMEKFYDRLEELWVGQGLPKIETTALGPTAVRRSQYEIWERIYSEAVINELANYINEAEQLAGKDEDILKRLQFVRNTFLEPIKEQSGIYMRQKRELEDLVMDVPILPADKPITLDGKLDEPVWQNVAKVQMVPIVEKAAPLKTYVSAFYQSGKLYLGFDCEEPKTDEMMLNVPARDGEVYADSCVEIFIKPGTERSRKNFYHIMINANGIVADEKGLVPGKSDWKWNADIQVKTTIEKSGRYVIEAIIPLDDLLGHAVAPDETILVNFARARFMKNDKPEDPLSIYYSWSPFLRFSDGGGGFHDIERFGTLRFGKDLKKK